MSSLSVAIVGLPNVGKSTLFNALTNSSILAANYPFATIEPNTGIVPVPDARLDVLAKMYQTDKVIPATVEFVDVAGLVSGASKGEGLGNKFLANIRECDAICHVVRAFDGDKVLRQTGDENLDKEINPAADIEIIRTELMLADIATIENHLPKVQKEAKSNPRARAKVDFLTALQNQLLAGKMPNELDDAARENLDGLELLTLKPTIYLFNVDENGLTDEKKKSELSRLSSSDLFRRSDIDSRDKPENDNDNCCLFICAELESEIRELSTVEATELLADYGVSESGLNLLAKAAYKTLGLQSFLTAGPKEVRAWTIRAGSTAPQAAGVIHTDFEKGFIAAQVVDYDDLISAGSESEARKLGKVRTEGKTYIMRENDVVEFRFNV